MVVLLLVVVWLVALVPVALRKFSEWQVTASVAEFRYRTRAMGRACPAAGPVGMPDVRSARPVPPVDPDELERLRRHQRARAAQQMARRRRALSVLTSVLGATFVLGAIPALRVLWDLSLVAFLLTTGYLALLVRFQRGRAVAAATSERDEKVVPIHAHRRHRDGVEGAAGEGRAIVGTLPPARPAFVLVDVHG